MEFPQTLRQTVEKYGLMAKKALGQNFLLDQNITEKIIRLSLEKQGLENFSNFDVLEIGPGPGGLTRAILQKTPRTLTVVEMDERCIQIMQELNAFGLAKMNILNQDALKTSVQSLGLEHTQVVSNLPYNISVPLLTGWLKEIEHIEALTLMFQKEVADRICAVPQTKAYGRISVLAQLTCSVERLCTLNPECFVPAPKIYSTVLLFRPLKNQPNKNLLKRVEYLTGLAFSMRRKMLRQSLKSVPHIEQICQTLHIEMSKRAEELLPEQYLQIAEQLS